MACISPLRTKPYYCIDDLPSNAGYRCRSRYVHDWELLPNIVDSHTTYTKLWDGILHPSKRDALSQLCIRSLTMRILCVASQVSRHEVSFGVRSSSLAALH